MRLPLKRARIGADKVPFHLLALVHGRYRAESKTHQRLP